MNLEIYSPERLQAQLDLHLQKAPRLGQSVYIADSAVVIGDVTMGDKSSVWHNATVRGDINRIEIGEGSNIQDNVVVHLADDFPCLIGSYVTVGHSAILHACTVGDESLIGMGAVVLDGAVVGSQCLIGAKALVTPGTIIPDGSMVLGSPAKVVRQLTDQERLALKSWALKYVGNSEYCLKNKIRMRDDG
jgi:carbonic anhydrase/acetyltransferase-like protein (isoleucine patch superfamily)